MRGRECENDQCWRAGWGGTKKGPVSNIVWAAWNGILAKTSVPGNIIHVCSLKSWLPQVEHTSCTKGLELVPPTPFIIDSKGVGTLLFVVRALFLNAVSASLFPFLNLSFSTSYIFTTRTSKHPVHLIGRQLNIISSKDYKVLSCWLKIKKKLTSKWNLI